MSALGQRALISLLVDPEALDLLTREGLDPECIPDEDLRKVVGFSLAYYHDSGRVKAPTEAVLRQYYGDLLDDREMTLGDAEESIEWAVDDLRATFVHREVSGFNKRLATSMSEVEITERVEVLSGAASELVSLSMRMESREFAVDGREGMTDRLSAYHARAASTSAFDGMAFGLRQIDEYTLGIRPGEMAVLAAPPKAGKSFWLAWVALCSWRAGRTCALFTLENSVDMTLDRIACMATGVDSRNWSRGQCTDDEVALMTRWTTDMQSSPNPLWVLQPDEGNRSAEQIVRQAQMRGADDLIIDQLSWVEAGYDTKNQARHEVVRDILRTLRVMISTGRNRMPCLIAHQINREGAKAADKDGYLSMWHLAESAEVERASDWVFGLYASNDERAALTTKFQTLASRREDIKHFLLTWRINAGIISVRSEITLDRV